VIEGSQQSWRHESNLPQEGISKIALRTRAPDSLKDGKQKRNKKFTCVEELRGEATLQNFTLG